MARSKGRAGRPWRRHRQQLLDSPATICEWCGQPVDKTLSGRNRWGPSADHIDPLGFGGQPLGEIRLMHNRCNTARGNHLRKLRNAQASRQW